MLRIKWWYGLVFNLVLAALLVSGAVLYSVQKRARMTEAASDSAAAKGFRYLEVRDAVSGRLYHRWLLEEGGEFTIEFVHSVHQSPVQETFTIKDGEIRPRAVRFYSFGAGMQSDLEEGQEMHREGDALVITGFKTAFRELDYIVGTVSDHLLFVDGKTVSLRDLCGKNCRIKIQVRGRRGP